MLCAGQVIVARVVYAPTAFSIYISIGELYKTIVSILLAQLAMACMPPSTNVQWRSGK